MHSKRKPLDPKTCTHTSGRRGVILVPLRCSVGPLLSQHISCTNQEQEVAKQSSFIGGSSIHYHTNCAAFRRHALECMSSYSAEQLRLRGWSGHCIFLEAGDQWMPFGIADDSVTLPPLLFSTGPCSGCKAAFICAELLCPFELCFVTSGNLHCSASSSTPQPCSPLEKKSRAYIELPVQSTCREDEVLLSLVHSPHAILHSSLFFRISRPLVGVSRQPNSRASLAAEHKGMALTKGVSSSERDRFAARDLLQDGGARAQVDKKPCGNTEGAAPCLLL